MKTPTVEMPNTEKQIFTHALNWETSRVLSSEKSERKAWWIAGSSLALLGMAIIAIAMMLPLKETVPYVIRVDNTTGVPDIVTAMTDKAVTGDEVSDKYWLAQYVRARETYDWYTLQRDYDTVGLLSSPNVGQSYAQLFEGKDALDKSYGKSVRATVEIMSVVPTGNNTGTVRFIKTTKRVDQEGSPGSVTKWVATIAYEYRKTARVKESVRLVNPFGFQVLTYRIDPEIAGNTQ